MTTPSARPTRRRARSPRVLAAVVLLVVAGVLVAVALLSGSGLLLAIAAPASVLLGTLATRTTYDELTDSRRESARERAALAAEYRHLSGVRSAEHQRFVAGMRTRIAALEATARDEQATLLERAHRAEERAEGLAARLLAAEDRAAQSLLRVVELEQEADVLTARWQADETKRRHA